MNKNKVELSDLIKVESSNIHMVGFNENTTYVEFKNGTIYSYPETTQKEFEDLVSSKSVGKHFHATYKLKNNYTNHGNSIELAKMDNVNNTVKEKEKLEAALKAGKSPIPSESTMGWMPKIEDQMAMANQYLSDRAKLALKKINRQSISFDNNFNVYPCVFFAIRTKLSNIEHAVQKISNILNELAKQDLIYSTLIPVSSVALARLPMQIQTFIVLAYVHAPADRIEEINNKYKNNIVPEGAMPEFNEDLSIELQDGEFLNVFKISHALGELTDPQELLENYIQTCLKILPSGTEVREVVKCTDNDLSIPYEIKFYNPKMKRVNNFNILYRRVCEMVDGKIEQFTVMTGIEYFDKDGGRLFV